MYLLKIFFQIYLACCMVSARNSLTILLDTTRSMQEEIDIIKSNIGDVVYADSSDIKDFVLVTFNDPGVSEPAIFQTPEALISSLNSLRVSGGNECPENSLAGIEKALEASNPGSYIFVFTDAFAKDHSRVTVETLCKNTFSKVFIFLSGRCPSVESKDVGSIDVYYDIAKMCSGAFLRFEPTNFRQAFTFMKEILKVDWNDVITYNTVKGCKTLSFSVDAFTTNVVLAVFGDSPKVQVSGPGQSRINKIMDIPHAFVTQIVDPEVGNYTVRVTSTGSSSASIFKRLGLPFQFGFSSRPPKSLRETSRKPIPGRTNYLTIQVSEDSNIEVDSVEIDFLDGNKRKVLTIDKKERTEDNNIKYICEAFFDPEKSFRIFIIGREISTHRDFTRSTKALTPHKSSDKEPKWIEPTVEMIDSSIRIEFGSNNTAACKVISYPNPRIWWEDEAGRRYSSEDVLLEIPNVHMSYVTLENLTSSGKLYCKARNYNGTDSQEMNVLVERKVFFDVIVAPKDQTIEYGADAKLYCEVNAYPEITTKWYHNNTFISDYDTKIEIIPYEKAILIRNMTLEETGKYTCEVSNDNERRELNAEISISGLESPEIELSQNEIVLAPGDWLEIKCNIIKGKPEPVITWKYKSDDASELIDIPEGVYSYESKLKISSAKPDHRGIYRCEAANIMGQDYCDASLKVQYAPIISNGQTEHITVKEGDQVELACEVDAIPTARVRWEISQGDVIATFDDRHSTDHRNTHRFEALWKDSGNYHCIAENNIGRAEKTVTVNVLVGPYIQAPESKLVTLRPGETLSLNCNVLFGNPEPSTKWEFVASDSTVNVLSRGKSPNTLLLSKISRYNQGNYICRAENEVGFDKIKIELKVLE